MKSIGNMAIALALGVFLIGTSPGLAADTTRIDPEALKALLGRPELALIDVRSGTDWKESTQKISGAVREDPERVDTWMNKYPKEKTLVFYCA